MVIYGVWYTRFSPVFGCSCVFVENKEKANEMAEKFKKTGAIDVIVKRCDSEALDLINFAFEEGRIAEGRVESFSQKLSRVKIRFPQKMLDT